MREEKIKNFVRNVLPEEGAVLGENDKVLLRAISDQDYDHYIEISKKGSFMEKMYSNEEASKSSRKIQRESDTAAWLLAGI